MKGREYAMPETADVEALTYDQIYAKLIINEDIILDELPVSDIKRLKKGLSSYKQKQNEKCKKFDLPLEDRKIIFEELAQNTKEGTVKIRIKFQERQPIKAAIKPADGTLL